jgi:hypothetical protein
MVAAGSLCALSARATAAHATGRVTVAPLVLARNAGLLLGCVVPAHRLCFFFHAHIAGTRLGSQRHRDCIPRPRGRVQNRFRNYTPQQRPEYDDLAQCCPGRTTFMVIAAASPLLPGAVRHRSQFESCTTVDPGYIGLISCWSLVAPCLSG